MSENTFHNLPLDECSFLVTGGAGFIGSNIVEYLLRHTAGKVRVLDNLSTGSLKNIETFHSNASFEFIEGDIRDIETCRLAVEGIDYISHQAALGSVPRSVNDPLTSNAVNISGFLNMLVAARDSGCKRFVYAASSSTYGDHSELPKKEENIGNPLSPYAVTKYVNELYAAVFSKTYSFHSIGLRYFNVFGPRQNPQGPYAAVIPLFIECALKKTPAIINGDGETSRDFTYVENAIQANIKALINTPHLQSHEVVNIAYGQRTTLNELWSLICSICSVEIEAVHREERVADVRHSLANIEKAKQLFGYNPQVSIREGLLLACNWYQTNNK